MKRIVLVGNYHGKNIGDNSICFSIIKNLKNVESEINFTIVSNNDSCNYGNRLKFVKGSCYNDIHFIHFFEYIEKIFLIKKNAFINNIFHLLELLYFSLFLIQNKETRDILKKSTCVVIGGGGIIQDTYKKSLIHYLGYIFVSHFLNKKIVLYCVGCAAIHQQSNKYLVNKIFNFVDLISVRDEDSKKLLENIGLENVISIYDPSFNIKFKKNNENVKTNQRKKIGISVIPYYDKRYWPVSNNKIYSKYKRTIEKIINELTSTKYNVCIIPTTAWDINVAKDIVKNVKDKSSVRILYSYDENDLMNHIDEMDILITTRYHSLIFAISMEKPVIAIDYHPKTKSLIDRFNLHKYAVSIDEINSKRILDLVGKIENDREIINQIRKIKHNMVKDNFKNFRKLNDYVLTASCNNNY